MGCKLSLGVKASLGALFLFLSLGVTSVASATTFSAVSSADTRMADTSGATSNYGDGVQISVGQVSASNNWRSVEYFDFSSIPSNAIVSSSTLILFVNDSTYATNARLLHAYPLLHSFVEMEATWNKRNSTTNWDTVGASADTDRSPEAGHVLVPATPSAGTEIEIPLAATSVQAMIHGDVPSQGWLLQNSTESADHVDYRSREHATTGERPTLRIIYTVPEATPELATSTNGVIYSNWGQTSSTRADAWVVHHVIGGGPSHADMIQFDWTPTSTTQLCAVDFDVYFPSPYTLPTYRDLYITNGTELVHAKYSTPSFPTTHDTNHLEQWVFDPCVQVISGQVYRFATNQRQSAGLFTGGIDYGSDQAVTIQTISPDVAPPLSYITTLAEYNNDTSNSAIFSSIPKVRFYGGNYYSSFIAFSASSTLRALEANGSCTIIDIACEILDGENQLLSYFVFPSQSATDKISTAYAELLQKSPILEFHQAGSMFSTILADAQSGTSQVTSTISFTIPAQFYGSASSGEGTFTLPSAATVASSSGIATSTLPLIRYWDGALTQLALVFYFWRKARTLFSTPVETVIT